MHCIYWDCDYHYKNIPPKIPPDELCYACFRLFVCKSSHKGTPQDRRRTLIEENGSLSGCVSVVFLNNSPDNHKESKDMSINMRTLKVNKVVNRAAQAVRFSIYFAHNTKAHTNLLKVRQLLASNYEENISYSVTIALLLEFYLANHQKYNCLQIPNNPEQS